MFDNLKESIEGIKEETRSYIDKSLEYYKLSTFKILAKSVSSLLKMTIFLVAVVMALLFLSIAGAFALGTLLESNVLGFLIIAGVYILIFILIFAIRSTFIDRIVLKKFSEIFFDK